MRILYIIHSLNIGGAETLVTNNVIQLKQCGEEIALIQLDDCDSFLNKRLQENDIPVYTVFDNTVPHSFFGKVWSILKRKATLVRNINKIICEYHPDIIHFHTNMLEMARLDLNYNQCFFSFHTEVSRSIVYPSKAFKNSLMMSCEKGLTVVALSEKMRRDIERELGQIKTIVIPNGIDVRGIRNGAVTKNCFCDEFNIPPNSFILGHVGRYHPVKNHEKVISIFKEVKCRCSEAYLVLIGDADSHRQKVIDEQIEEYQLTDYVIQLGERQDAQELMAAFDCMILPSFTEGFPLVLGECQAHGVRCIATDAVPDEVLVNDNAFKLSIAESDSTWADYVLGTFLEKKGRNIMELDVSESVKKCLKNYEEVMG